MVELSIEVVLDIIRTSALIGMEIIANEIDKHRSSLGLSPRL